MGVLSQPTPPPTSTKVFPGLSHFFCPSSTSVNYTKLKSKNKGGNEASDSHICTWVQTTMSFRMQRHHKAEHPDQWRVSVGMGKVTMLCPDWNQYSRVLHLWVSPHNLLEAFCTAKDGKPETLTYKYYLRAYSTSRYHTCLWTVCLLLLFVYQKLCKQQ